VPNVYTQQQQLQRQQQFSSWQRNKQKACEPILSVVVAFLVVVAALTE